MRKLSYIDQIKTAATAEEVQDTLAKLLGFKYAHPKTVRRAKRAADRRIKEVA